MPLPKIDLPIYDLKLVSQPTPIKFRPFLVKEEKILLMALQSEDETTILSAIKQVINNCIVTESVDIDKIPIFDLEYLFLNIRARSVGEMIETYYMCRNVLPTEGEEPSEEEAGEEKEPNECSNLMLIQVNLTDIKPPILDIPSKIMITDKIGIQMKFPNLMSFSPIKDLIISGDNDAVFDLIYSCSEYVFDADGVYYTSESSKEEFDNLLNSLTQEQFDRITNFFEVLPKMEFNTKHTCDKCGFVHDIHLEGLNDFFT